MKQKTDVPVEDTATKVAIGDAILKPLREGVVPVDEWIPNPEDLVVTYAGKTMIVPFNRIFERNTVESINVFDLALKEAYYKKLDTITKYINYFLKYYDPDKELIMAYLKLKHMIDSVKTKKLRREALITYVNKWLFSKSMCAKLSAMSKDNYRVDLTPKKKKKGGKDYPVGLQFNEHHAEILMRISLSIKILIPVVMHYIKTFKTKKEVKDHLYEYYMPLFSNPLLNDGVNILNKLYESISVRVGSRGKKDRVVYDKHEALGSSVESFIEDLRQKNIITDTVCGYKYNGNIVSFNSVVLDSQLKFHAREDLKIDFNVVSTEKDDPEGLSGLDKLEVHTTKIDSFLVLFSKVNIADTIERIKSRIKLEISEEEIRYYMDNYDYNIISKELICYYFAKYFGGFRDLDLIRRRNYTILMIIMKRMLEAEGCKYLSVIISSNIKGKASARTIRNSRFLEKVKTSSRYQTMKEKKYGSLGDELIVLLSKIINTNWTIVDYDIPGSIGEPLELNDDVLSEEYLNFADNI